MRATLRRSLYVGTMMLYARLRPAAASMDGRLDTAPDLSLLLRRALRRSLTTGWVAGTGGTSGSQLTVVAAGPQPTAAVAEGGGRSRRDEGRMAGLKSPWACV